ncbi:MAG TPA: DUF4129 domain-containing protein [Vicinamibacteria bacterium]|nr:DUF4129 domain-containing protein [Vicinamibacteria bacterium]
MDSPGVARLAAARTVALYLLSLLAAASADLAWRPPDAVRLAVRALTLGFAAGLGGALADSLSSVGSGVARARTRQILSLFLPVPGLLALAVVVAAPHLAAQAASALALVQTAVLLLVEALGLEILALWGALVLTLLAGLAGGFPALAGLTGFLVLAAVFLSLDHASKRIAAWPGVPPPALRLVLGDGLRVVAIPALLLALALLLLPAPPTAALGAGLSAPVAPEVQRAYHWLALLALAGGGSVTFAMRWLRGGGSETPPLVEPMESRVEAEEALEPAAPDRARYAAARGRVIRAYLRFLSRARQAGFRIERHLTAREIQDRLGRPGEPLARLTDLFMDARYGPDEPEREAVRAAEAASRAVCARLRVRPHRDRTTPLESD